MGIIFFKEKSGKYVKDKFVNDEKGGKILLDMTKCLDLSNSLIKMFSAQ